MSEGPTCNNDWHEPQMKAAVCGGLHLSRSMPLFGDHGPLRSIHGLSSLRLPLPDVLSRSETPTSYVGYQCHFTWRTPSSVHHCRMQSRTLASMLRISKSL